MLSKVNLISFSPVTLAARSIGSLEGFFVQMNFDPLFTQISAVGTPSRSTKFLMKRSPSGSLSQFAVLMMKPIDCALAEFGRSQVPLAP